METNPSIINALVIGCGGGGILREINHYPSIEKIDMVEMDELVVKLAI